MIMGKKVQLQVESTVRYSEVIQMDQVKEGTLKHNILEILQECCVIPRRDIGFSFPDRKTGQPRTNDRSIRHAIQELIADNYIAVYHKKREYCYLTKNGWEQLNHIRAMQGIPMGLSDWTTIRKSTFNRQLMIGEAVNICHAAGLGAFPSEKPHLTALIQAESGRTYPEYTTANKLRYKNVGMDMTDILQKGVFYQSREVKELLRFHELEDFTGYSRFVGIILTSNDLYFVYNTLDRLIRWYETAESRIIRCISSLFADCTRYQHQYQSPDEAKGIIFAQGDSMIPALVTGHKYGHVRSNLGNDTIKHPLKQIHASVIHHSHSYMIPTNKDGIIHLRNAIHLTSQTIAALNQIQADKNRQFLYSPQNAYVQLVRREDGISTAFLPWYNVKQLQWIRENLRCVHVITYPNFLPYISKSLGLALKGASHADTGEPLWFPRYDDSGEEITNKSL